MIAPLRLKQRKPYRMIVYDFECTQDEEANIGQKKRFRHKPNFISATIICTECIDKGCWDKTLPPNGCDICGEHRTMTWAPFEFQGTEVCKKVTTDNPLKSFVEWLLFEQESRYKSICFAHYGGRYDMTFILGELLRQRRQNEFIPLPELILNGSKMYEMKVKKGKQNPEIWLRDSYNLMPIALSGLVKAWGLQISEKQHFPHMFNRMRNLNNVLPHLPPKEDYLMDQMKKEQLEKFLKWYEDPSNYNTVFDLKDKLPEYCCSDVQILTHSLVALRKEFFAVSLPNKFKNPAKGSIGIDILHDSMTIASACIKHWAMNYVKEDELAIIREQGYDNPDTQSNIALKWLAWFGKTNRVNVQTAESPEGEHRVKRADGGVDYRVDGFVRRPGHPRGDLALEVNGCRYHGCRRCYPDDSQQLTRDKTAGQLRAKDQDRLRLLRQQMEVKVVWTCDIERELSRDVEMRKFFRGYRCPSPIRIRDSFYGGRTGPQKLYQRLKPGYKISYKE
jgi:G:T-mismatch repair DNA endonuclease (very short patch repair protein)